MTNKYFDDILKYWPRSLKFPEPFICPRGCETPLRGEAIWGADECCSFCGSLNPNVFMERIENGTLLLEPTNKNYKVYISPHKDSIPLKQSVREGFQGENPSEWNWTLKDVDYGKFYFQHLSDEQMKKFVELLNRKEVKFNLVRGFTVLPFFISSSKTT